MRKVCILGTLVAAIGWVSLGLIGHALEHEPQQHVLYTRPDGVTLDCEWITDVAGRSFYDSCIRVP